MMSLVAVLMSAATMAAANPMDLSAFHDTYRELVETDTTFSNGSCTAAAQKMAVRLRACGLRRS